MITDMAIPDDKTCGDCRHFQYCIRLFSADAKAKHCDWSPNRFLPVPKALGRGPK